jgi:hypothetical protein
MLRRVALVRAGISEESIPSINRAKIISDLGTLAVTSNCVFELVVSACVVLSSLMHSTLMMEAIVSSETSVGTRATQRNIPEDGILHSHSRENMKYYIALTAWTL